MTDEAGNSAVFNTGDFKIDKTAPTLTFGAPSGTLGTNGWYISNVSIPYTTGDNLSGVASSIPASPVVLSTEGAAVSDNVTVTDEAGNSAVFNTGDFKIDKTAPVPQIVDPADGAVVWCYTVRLAEVQTNGTDAVRNVWQVLDADQNVVFQTESLDALNEFEVFWDSHTVADGPYTVWVEMFDAAGNSGTDSIQITVDNNAPPTVDDISVLVFGGDTLTILPEDIESLFHDADGDDLRTLKIVQLPQHGALLVTLVGNPVPQTVVADVEVDFDLVENLIYDPAENYVGPDNFIWNASDGTAYAVNPATVSITVWNIADDIVGRSPAGQWWVAKSTGVSFVNELWGTWSTITWLDVRVADVNNDGRADIVGRTEWGDWWVAKANETGTGFDNQLWGHWDPVAWQDVAVGDFNGDGRDDIVGRSPAGEWWVAKTNETGTGSVNELWGTWSPITWLDVHVADVSGDGRADIVGRTESGDWYVAKTNGTGTGSDNGLWGHWDPVAWQDVAVADVNGDGRADIVGRNDAGVWYVAKANETGTGFVTDVWGVWSPITWLDVHVADFNGDGRADIVGRTDAGVWYVAKANETGTYSTNELWGVWSPITWLDVQAADVNGDGQADIVGRTDAGQWWVAKTNETGTGSVNELWGDWSPVVWSDVHAADVTGQEVPALTALAAAPSPAAEPLGQEQLSLAVEQAILHWEAAGLTAAPLAAFRDVQVVIADLPGLQLGMATSSAIVLDVNAAGYGWSVEIDPQDRETAASRMDLLTAVLHELGHVAGLADDYGAVDSADVMSGWLLPGTRRLPTLADLDGAFADGTWIAD